MPRVRSAEPTAPQGFPSELPGVEDADKGQNEMYRKCKRMLHSASLASHTWTLYAAANNLTSKGGCR